jgi:hypothetical protein
VVPRARRGRTGGHDALHARRARRASGRSTSCRWDRPTARSSRISGAARAAAARSARSSPRLSSSFLPAGALDLPLTHESLKDAGSGLGCGGVSFLERASASSAASRGSPSSSCASSAGSARRAAWRRTHSPPSWGRSRRERRRLRGADREDHGLRARRRATAA